MRYSLAWKFLTGHMTEQDYRTATQKKLRLI